MMIAELFSSDPYSPRLNNPSLGNWIHRRKGRGIRDGKGPLPDCVEERRSVFQRIRASGSDDKELTGDSHVGPAKHRRCNKTLPSLRVSSRKAFRQSDTDRARRNVDCAFREAHEHGPLAEHQIFDGVVACQHGDDGVVATGIGWCDGDLCALSG